MRKYASPLFWKQAKKQFKKHGTQLLYCRFVLRKEILDTAAVPCPPESSMEVHTQVCERDWINMIWSMKSFRHYSGKKFRLVVHCNKLTTNKEAVILKHFPGSIISNESSSNNMIPDSWKKYHKNIINIKSKSNTFTIKKVLDSYFLSKNDIFFTIDPDVLFFKKPEVLLESAEKETHLSSCFNILRFPKESTEGMFCIDQESSGLRFDKDFGTGCGWIRKKFCDWDLIENVLSKNKIIDKYGFMIDQTISAIWASTYGYKRLDPNIYTIEPVYTLEGVVTRHYYAKTRDLMYIEGMTEIKKRGLIDLWKKGHYGE